MIRWRKTKRTKDDNNAIAYNNVTTPSSKTVQNRVNPTIFGRLENMKQIGFSPKVIFDCGAHVGGWTQKVSRIFNDSFYILFEPNPLVFNKINYYMTDSNVEYKALQKAVGSKSGVFTLNIWEDVDQYQTGSSFCNHVRGDAAKKIECEITTLDLVCEELDLVPGLVKLDLQGYEIEALKGSKNVLEKTELFIIEFGCLEAYVDRTTPRDLIDLMYENDYSLYDIVDMHYRPYDNALTGGDFFFIKNNSKLKAHKGWE